MIDIENEKKKLHNIAEEYNFAAKSLEKAQKEFDLAKEAYEKEKIKLENIQSKLSVIEDALADARGMHPYTAPELFNERFIKNNTEYDNHEEFFTASGISPDELVNFRDHKQKVDTAIRKMTKFNTFEEFVKEAILELSFHNHGMDEIPDFVRDGTEIF